MAFNSPEDLLKEACWLERLALALTHDAHVAQDLVQETWLAALRREEPPRESEQAWLRGTLRKLALKRLRSRGRRARHEERATPAGYAPSAEELTARAETQEKLLACVGELPEAYRVPILLRYYDGLNPREIARELGEPLGTVKTRIRQGLIALRDNFSASFVS